MQQRLDQSVAQEKSGKVDTFSALKFPLSRNSFFNSVAPSCSADDTQQRGEFSRLYRGGAAALQLRQSRAA